VGGCYRDVSARASTADGLINPNNKQIRFEGKEKNLSRENGAPKINILPTSS
jgi:hypothetical protein